MFIVFKKHSKDIYPNEVIKTTFLAVRPIHRLFFLFFTFLADGNIKRFA